MLQQENPPNTSEEINPRFLEIIENKLKTYSVQALDFNMDNSEEYSLSAEYLDECIATGENKATYLLNRYIEDILAKTFINFSSDYTNYLPFNATSDLYPECKLDRLKSNLGSHFI